MNISVNFKKKPWLRRVYPDKAKMTFASDYKPIVSSNPKNNFVQLTAQDLLNELAPAAHEINSPYMSHRPIWKKTGNTKDGKDEWVIDGYDDLECVALGWQQFIVGNKVAHLTGSGVFDLANETKDTESYENILSWIDSCGIQ